MAPLATMGLLALAGGAGAVARFLVDWGLEAAGRLPGGGRFPVSTVTVNVSGAFLAGAVAGALATGALSPSLGSAASVGFLGAFTTFSTWMVQIVDLWEGGERRSALLHLLGSLVAGVAAAALGLMLVVSLGVAPPGSQP